MPTNPDLFDLDPETRIAVADEWGRELAHADMEKQAMAMPFSKKKGMLSKGVSKAKDVGGRAAGSVLNRIRKSGTTGRLAAGAAAGGAAGALTGNGEDRGRRGAIGAAGGAAAALGVGKGVDALLKRSKGARNLANASESRGQLREIMKREGISSTRAKINRGLGNEKLRRLAKKVPFIGKRMK